MNLQEKINVMQAALDGKEIEFADIKSNHWLKVPLEGKDHIGWDWQNRKYRIAQTKDYIDWSHVSDEYKWMARDEDGMTYLLSEKPTQHGVFWYTQHGLVSDASSFKSFKQGTVPWEESLIERTDQHTTIKFYADRITIET